MERKLFLTSIGIKPEVQQELNFMLGRNKARQRVVFIPRVEHDGSSHFTPNQMHRWFEGQGFKMDVAILDPKHSVCIRTAVERADVIALSGGNPSQSLKLLRETNLDQIIFKKVDKGTPLVGPSAACMLAGPTIEPSLYHPANDRNSANLTDFTGLRLIPDIVWPHYQPDQHQLIQTLSRSFPYPFRLIGNHQAAAYYGIRVTTVGAAEREIAIQSAPVEELPSIHKQVKSVLAPLQSSISRITDPDQRKQAQEADRMLKWAAGVLRRPGDSFQLNQAKQIALTHVPIAKSIITSLSGGTA